YRYLCPDFADLLPQVFDTPFETNHVLWDQSPEESIAVAAEVNSYYISPYVNSKLKGVISPFSDVTAQEVYQIREPYR
ncbi:unnamed protein product, partial [Oppiella nova]